MKRFVTTRGFLQIPHCQGLSMRIVNYAINLFLSFHLY